MSRLVAQSYIGLIHLIPIAAVPGTLKNWWPQTKHAGHRGAQKGAIATWGALAYYRPGVSIAPTLNANARNSLA